MNPDIRKAGLRLNRRRRPIEKAFVEEKSWKGRSSGCHPRIKNRMLEYDRLRNGRSPVVGIPIHVLSHRLNVCRLYDVCVGSLKPECAGCQTHCQPADREHDNERMKPAAGSALSPHPHGRDSSNHYNNGL